MKILFLTRSKLLKTRGGAEVQLLKTKEYLEKLYPDFKIDTSCSLIKNMRLYDVVHIFNNTLIIGALTQTISAKLQRKKVVFSPIYWDQEELYNYIIKNKINRVLIRFRTIIKSLLIKLIIIFSDAILPNSFQEIKLIKEKFRIKNKKFYRVVNGVDIVEERNIKPQREILDFIKKNNLKDCILCITRIDKRKNLLALIEAIKQTNFKLLIVGKVTDKDYFEILKKNSNKNIYFYKEMGHKYIYNFYKYAKVHTLVSWYETPGLSNLEAASMGCNIATTNRGSTQEYFGYFAEYCNPADVESIKRALIKAYSKSYPNYELKNYIYKNFTWSIAAKETKEVYDTLSGL